MCRPAGHRQPAAPLRGSAGHGRSEDGGPAPATGRLPAAAAPAAPHHGRGECRAPIPVPGYQSTSCTTRRTCVPFISREVPESVPSQMLSPVYYLYLTVHLFNCNTPHCNIVPHIQHVVSSCNNFYFNWFRTFSCTYANVSSLNSTYNRHVGVIDATLEHKLLALLYRAALLEFHSQKKIAVMYFIVFPSSLFIHKSAVICYLPACFFNFLQ